jgi:frataxin-like iron-binding protein CyaY
LTIRTRGVLIGAEGRIPSRVKERIMDKETRLLEHADHAIRIDYRAEDGIATLECDTCGEYLLEQFDDGMVLWG